MVEYYSRYTPAQKKAAKKYHAEKLDSIQLYVPKGKRELIKSHAANNGESMNGFINRAIDEAMARDQDPDQDGTRP